MPAAPHDDAPLPPELATRAERAGVAKAQLPLDQMLLLSVLGGAFISMGSIFFTVVTAGDLDPGLSRLLGGVTFSLGLVLVVAAGAELFTGNTLIVMAAASRRITVVATLRCWAVVFVGNAIGAIATAAAVVGAEHYEQDGGAVGARMLAIADTKTALDPVPALLLGVLANALVCLAVWLSLGARTLTDKVVVVVGPVAAFVAAGFEHSIANLYLVPAALFVKAWAPDDFFARIGSPRSAFSDVTWGSFLGDNLIPVTIGNIIGGAGLVGAVYWLAYLRPRETAPTPTADREDTSCDG